jgi:hypothetical protein
MDVLIWCAEVLAASLVVPSLTSLWVEGWWRPRWRLEGTREAAFEVAGQGAFREATVRATVASVERARAPGALRAAAFSCWFLAQMVIPGALAWGVGVLVLGESQNRHDPVSVALMASFFPGAWCAVLLWKAGNALVRGERAPADRATRRAATFIVAYNALVIAASALWAATHRHEEPVLLCAVYGAVSIVQVSLARAAFAAHREAYPIEHASG